ncbi:MAG TPA: hypothetical protein VF060_34235 [Trebonia sp.]
MAEQGRSDGSGLTRRTVLGGMLATGTVFAIGRPGYASAATVNAADTAAGAATVSYDQYSLMVNGKGSSSGPGSFTRSGCRRPGYGPTSCRR